MFGLVLAIGIVVDDAIVVVEAVEHHIEEGLSPRDATVKAMDEVSGPVVAIGLVLAAVFVPCTFIGGIVGQFFRQFAITIAVSTLISAFNSLTLSPALAALLLRSRERSPWRSGSAGHAEPLPRLSFLLAGGWLSWEFLTVYLRPYAADWTPWLPGWAVGVACLLAGVAAGWILAGLLNRLLGWFFAAFNVGFNAATRAYTRSVGWLLRGSVAVLLVYAGLLYSTYHLFNETPTGFIPQQDKGYLLVNVQLPDSASLGRTELVMRRIEQMARETEGVKHTVAIAGQSLLLGANASNFGSMYVMLDDFHHRLTPGLGGDAIAGRLREAFQAEVRDGLISLFPAPPVEGLGTAGGFKIMIEDRGDLGAKTLQGVTQSVVEDAAATGQLSGLFTSFRADTPWLRLDIDRQTAKMLGVNMAEVFSTLQVYVGSLYVNDFNRFGRTWQVNVQADAGFRKRGEDIRKLKVRNEKGEMVPLGAFASLKEVNGPVMLTRYNMYPAAAINGTAAPGTSRGQALERMEELAQRALVQSIRTEWTELAFLQLAAGDTAMIAFVLAVVLVFLVLAAQYESWSLPLAVILVVPMCLLCSVAWVIAARLDINLFTQIGFVVLVGLACKNAILIVEFARLRRDQGAPTRQATLEACQLRLRPILMTSFAFVLGVVPLVLAEGAGAEMRRTLGTAVFWGMLGVTLFGIFLTPVFFYVIGRLTDWRARRKEDVVAAGPRGLPRPHLDGHVRLPVG